MTSSDKKNFQIGMLRLTEWQFIGLIYIVCVIIRFLTGAYMKHIETFPDEQLYRYPAEAIARWDMSALYDTTWGTHRVLYPILIAPAFFANSRYVQTLLLQFINSLLISSTIFPTAIMARRVIDKDEVRKVCYLFFLLLPELCQSVTFAAENLFLPLTSWFIVIFLWTLDGKEEKRLCHDILLGVMIYIMKLCKDSTQILFFGVVIYYFYESFWIQKKGVRCYSFIRRCEELVIVWTISMILERVEAYTWFRYLKRDEFCLTWKDGALLSILIFCVMLQKGRLVIENSNKAKTAVKRISFVMCIIGAAIVMFVIGYAILAPGSIEDKKAFVGQRIPAIGSYLETPVKEYCCYLFYNLMYIMMAVGILPIIFPFMFSEKLNNRSRLLYTVMNCLLIAGAVIMTLYMARGITGDIPPRGIIRYVCYLWIPYMLCFASIYEKGEKQAIGKKKTIFFVIIMTVSIVLFKGGKTGSSIDMDMLFYIVYHFTYVMWQLKLPLMVAIVLAMPIYYMKREWLFKGFAFVMCLVWVLDNGLMLKDHYDRYGMSKEEYAKIEPIDSLIRENSHGTILLVYDTGEEKEKSNTSKIRESFITPYRHVSQMPLYIAEIWENDNGEIVLQNGIAHFGLSDVNYLLIQKDMGYVVEDGYAECVESTSDAYYIAYKLNEVGIVPQIRKATESF